MRERKKFLDHPVIPLIGRLLICDIYLTSGYGKIVDWSPLDPKHLVRGQFEGYKSEKGVAPDSKVETFAAVRLEIQSWRWSGVPFLIRVGKCLCLGSA
jgi:hypothetical protein